jgi:hypothetical protein
MKPLTVQFTKPHVNFSLLGLHILFIILGFINMTRHLSGASHTELLTIYISVAIFIQFTALGTSNEFQGSPTLSILR